MIILLIALGVVLLIWIISVLVQKEKKRQEKT